MSYVVRSVCETYRPSVVAGAYVGVEEVAADGMTPIGFRIVAGFSKSGGTVMDRVNAANEWCDALNHVDPDRVVLG